jgi:hypothetical protein
MKRILNQLLLSGIAYLITQLLLMVVLNILNMSYFDTEVWVRWDSGHYLAIAQNGYEFFPCSGKFGYPIDSKEMCGNTGWFPGYPFLIKLFSGVVGDVKFLGVIISKVFFFLSLLMILVILKINKITLRNICYTLLPSFFFGFIYYNSIFPISTFLFFSLLGIHHFLKRRYWLTGLICCIVSFIYPTGFLLSFAFAFTIFIREINDGEITKLTNCIPILFCGGMGVVLAFLVFQYQVDDWTAFIQVQSKYGHGFHNPIKSIWNMLRKISFNHFTLNDIIILQSVLVIIGYISISFSFFLKKLYRSELHVFSYLFITLFLIFPWVVGGNLSMYRAESLLMPCVFLLKDLKTPWIISLLAILISIGGIMSYLFFTSVLV